MTVMRGRRGDALGHCTRLSTGDRGREDADEETAAALNNLLIWNFKYEMEGTSLRHESGA